MPVCPESLERPRSELSAIDVWWVRTDEISTRRAARYEAWLSKAERGRAASIAHSQQRASYTRSRAVLRSILARYTGSEPERIPIRERQGGKPVLEDGMLAFNVTHSAGLTLFAISRRAEVGIDVERIRSDVSVDRIAARFFTEREAIMLWALPPRRRIHAFFTLWTCKEAYLKARGWGLAKPLDEVEVALPATGRPVLRDVRGGHVGWWLTALAPAPGFAAAMVVKGPEVAVRLHAWQP